MDLDMKTCTKCGEEKPLSEFHRRGKSGRVPQCKTCKRATNAAVDPAVKLAYSKKYRDANKNKRRETKRASRARKPWLSTCQSGRARAQVVGNEAHNEQRIDTLYALAHLLRHAGRDVHVDHIVPLSKHGAHAFENLQILTAEDNLRKGDKLPS